MFPSLRAMSNRLALVLILGATLMIGGCIDDDVAAVGGTAEVTVMTRNLYIGGDIFRLTTATPQQIPLVVAQLFGTVQVNDFEARAGALAAEIEAADPDLIGLQEVSLFRIQDPGDYLAGTTTPNAQVVYLDYLQVLLDSLTARGLDYTVAAQVENADVELPAAKSQTEFFDVRLTDRDVILARSDVGTASPGAATFSTLAPLPVGGQVLDFPRGYTWVNAMVDGVGFLFLNTHLEVSAGGQLTVVQAAQAYELTGGFGGVSPLIMVGDFNTGPGDSPYAILTSSFPDAWTGGDGFTCCQPEVLLQTGTFDERIDLILYRGVIDVVSTEVVGDEAADRTAGGLWPSDHAGVVATLRIHE
jgi:endonuclease/exonuclease/phosphatase family metal-dependent hydrolase